MMEELEAGEVEYKSAEEFLTSLRKEFGGGEEESVKAAELRKLEQGGKTMEEFVQEFKMAACGSGYEGRLLVEEFKRGMNGGIRRKLMERKTCLPLLNNGTGGQQPLIEIRERVGGKKRDCEEEKNREEGLQNKSKDRACHDL